MGQYDVAISYARENEDCAAALYRRLSKFVDVFFDLAVPLRADPRPLPDVLKPIYENCGLIVAIVGPTYDASDFPSFELHHVNDRLQEQEPDRVQLISFADVPFPSNVRATEKIRGSTGHVELPKEHWHPKIDHAARQIVEKVTRLVSGGKYQWRKGPPPTTCRDVDPGPASSAPWPVRRHLSCLTPLFDGPNPPQDLLAFARAGTQGCASLYGYIEHLQLATDLHRWMRVLASCVHETASKSLREYESTAKSAAKRLLEALRSTDESLAATSLRKKWKVPDDHELIHRLRLYLHRHLEDVKRHPERAHLISRLNDLLCTAPGGLSDEARFDRIRVLCLDAGDVADSIYTQLIERDGQPKLVPAITTALSPEALRFPVADTVTTRRESTIDHE